MKKEITSIILGTALVHGIKKSFTFWHYIIIGISFWVLFKTK
jgi:hypothetical protein